MGTSMISFAVATALFAAVAQEDTGSNGPVEQDTSVLKTQKEYWDAVTAKEQAEIAALQKQAELVKLKIGTIPGLTATGGGTVTEGASPARPEVMVLAARASRETADDIAENIKAAYPENGAPANLVLVGSTADLSFSSLNLFDFQKETIKSLLSTAQGRLRSALEPEPDASGQGARIAPITVLGAGLDAAAKFASYFSTDYKFGTVEVTKPDNMMAYAVSNAVKRKFCPGVGHCTQVNTFIPAQLAAANVTSIISDLSDLAVLNQDVLLQAGQAKTLATKASAGKAAELTAAAAYGELVSATYKTFMDTLLATPQGAAEPLLERVLRQQTIKDKLYLAGDGLNPRPGTDILVLSDKAEGAYYTKKNLWTFLGGPPLYAKAAWSVSYTLLRGDDRSQLTSGTAVRSTGYRSIRAVDRDIGK